VKLRHSLSVRTVDMGKGSLVQSVVGPKGHCLKVSLFLRSTTTLGLGLGPVTLRTSDQ